MHLVHARAAVAELHDPAVESVALVADVLAAEGAALMAAAANAPLVAAISEAARMIARSEDMLVIAGIGKSGHVARKLAASFCSLGKRACFLHPTEASHGDLGIIGPRSIILILSNSGETAELGDLLAYAATCGNPVIGLTANAESTLGRTSVIALAYGKQTEACRNGLAPTTSTTLALAIGDALAVAVSDSLGFRPEDFRRFHPGGKLGARLARAGNLLVPLAECPKVAWDAPALDAILAMARNGSGFALVEAAGGAHYVLTGDGLRVDGLGLMSCSAGELADRDGLAVTPATTAEQALRMMAAAGRQACLVHDERGALLGVLRRRDCA